MKKIYKFMFLVFLVICNTNVYATEKIKVYLDKCVDGDTAWFYIDNVSTKVRFLAIDTPESTNEIEPYGKEASEFTCNKLKQANVIELEYDDNSDSEDKYGRKLAWIFVDNELLQDLIIKNGLAEVKYLYGDYKYTNILQNSLEIAKEKKINMWSNTNNNDYTILFFTLIIVIIIYIFSKSSRNKINKNIVKIIKKQIKK